MGLSVVVPIFNGNGDIRNCRCYRAVKLLEHVCYEVGGKGVKTKTVKNNVKMLMRCNVVLCLKRKRGCLVHFEKAVGRES